MLAVSSDLSGNVFTCSLYEVTVLGLVVACYTMALGSESKYPERAR